MWQNEIVLESLSRQWQQERIAAADQSRVQAFLRSLRKQGSQAR